MWIEKQPNGKFRYRMRYEDNNGVERRVSVTLDRDTPQARNKARDILEKRIASKLKQPLNDDNITFEYLSQKYLELGTGHLKPATIRSRTSQLKTINRTIGNQKMTSALFNDFVLGQSRKFKRSTVMARYDSIVQVLRFATNYGYFDATDIIHRLVLPKQSKPKSTNENLKYLEPHELDMVVASMSAVDERFGLACLIMASTGLRYGEFVALDYERHIDFKENTILVERTYDELTKTFGTPKSGKSRDVYFNHETKEWLQTLIVLDKRFKLRHSLPKDNNFILKTKGGRPQWMQLFNNHLKKVNIPNKKVTSHIFRHTYITRMVENNVPPHLIAQQVGHADTNMIESVYKHYSDRMKNQLESALENISFK